MSRGTADLRALPDLPNTADVCIVGGGQSGLAVAYHLQRLHRRTARRPTVVVLDGRAAPGGAWRDAWPSLTLFSPAGYSSLPGRLMPRPDGGSNPDAAHVVDYLTDYEHRYAIDVRRPVRVREVAADPSAAESWVVHTDHGTVRARTVVNATGTWDRPFWPAVRGIGDFRGRQLHTHDYRGPRDLDGDRVLVVGGGNSGAQVAADLVGSAVRVHWVTREPPRYLPDDVDGRVLFETATQAVRDRAAGREARGVASLGDIVAVPPVRAARDRGDLVAEPMVAALTPDGARWPDGSTAPLDAVVWATGFRPALAHLHGLGLQWRSGRPATVAPAGSPHAVRSADRRSLWFVGYGDWCGPASATLIGVGRPARDTAADIADHLGTAP
ncbi:NAD(P)/FAD-dependent oxidoreductase [Nocardioides panacisoli]|uniref:ArsO family NAD(P)H-dependent flavin-containing monooxygenase n=1 Tax=Nocardioides panacisoli TaxID=627624 RepID=UPI001C62D17D|nr:ArsO family NAD(P)H-dependent flavin-containing monooxygenase [Nocardioides panacisoli]QYJ02813.1 NAD(P)/FAD-dependent oxidoreductase [Nocardioides panacisoli]